MTVLTLDIKDDLLGVNEYDSSIIGLDNRNYVLDSVNEDVDTIEITGFGDYNVTYNNSIDCIEDNAHVQIQKQYTVNPDNLTIKYDNYGNLLIETNIPNDYLGNYWGNDPTNENEGTRIIEETTYRAFILKDFAKNPFVRNLQIEENTIDLLDSTILFNDEDTTNYNLRTNTLSGTEKDETINAIAYEAQLVTPRKGNSYYKGLTIKASNNRLNTGEDIIFGSDGNDTIYMAKGGGEVTGGKGDDVIYIDKKAENGTVIKYYIAKGTTTNTDGNEYGDNPFPNLQFNGTDTIYNSSEKDTLYLDTGSPSMNPVFVKNGNDLEFWTIFDGDDAAHHYDLPDGYEPEQKLLVFKNYFKQAEDKRLDKVIIHAAEDDWIDDPNRDGLVDFHWVDDKEMKLSELMSLTNYGLYIKGKGKLNAVGGYDNFIEGTAKSTMRGSNDIEHLETFAGGIGNDTITLGKGLSKIIYDYENDLEGVDTITFNKGGSATISYGKDNDDDNQDSQSNDETTEITRTDFMIVAKKNDLVVSRVYRNDEGNITKTKQVYVLKNYDSATLREALFEFPDDTFDMLGEWIKINANENSALNYTGTNMNETLIGSTQKDVIKAGGGYDLILAGGGNDQLTGGAGLNIFHLGSVHTQTLDENGDIVDQWDNTTLGTGGNKIVNLGSGQNIFYFGTEPAIEEIRKERNDLKIVRGDNDTITIKNYFNNTNDNVFITNDLTYTLAYQIEPGDNIFRINEDADYKYSAPVSMKEWLNSQDVINAANNIDYSDPDTYRKGMTINGTFLNETIIGTTKADVIKSNGGTDEITGGLGNDKLYGGSGETIFFFDEGDGNDTLFFGTGDNIISGFDYDSIDEGGIKINKNGDVIFTHTYLDYDKYDREITKKDTLTIKNYLKAGTDNIYIENESLLTILEDADLYKAIENPDTYGKKAVKKNGTGLNDTLYGSIKADVISGGDGDDTIYGGAGNDKITVGKKGNNYIDGGAGNDIYNISLSDGYVNTIVDESGIDTLNLTVSNDIVLNGLGIYFELSNVQESNVPVSNVYGMKYDFKASDILITSSDNLRNLTTAPAIIDENGDTVATNGLVIKDFFTSEENNGVYTSKVNAIETINLSQQTNVSWIRWHEEEQENGNETQTLVWYDKRESYTTYLDEFYFNNTAQNIACWLSRNGFDSSADVFETNDDDTINAYMKLYCGGGIPQSELENQ